ncbi:MAG: P-II family nitrogen regulator [Gammaproteobacteria bacterium]|nr:P-II family nitrogen regulator [Gammaproteobacteria bacterium]MDH3505960.1 P-II family nitrogen regulator [Gammaproteobacteria bacterium]
MHFKLVLVFVEDSKTEAVIQAARESGATGCTVINHARGEGIEKHKSFFGLALSGQRDVLLLLVEKHLSRQILERIAEVGEFDDKPGTGIAIQIDVEDAVGVLRQSEILVEVVEDQL